MAICALMKISNAQGECKLDGEYRDKWIEVQAWDWEVEAETSWTKGGGASVGKPNPGKLKWEHYFDRSSCTLLTYICSGAAFDEVELRMFKGTGGASITKTTNIFFKMVMKGAFITNVSNSATEEGNVSQKIEMVFKEVKIDYFMQDDGTKPNTQAGMLKSAGSYSWDIPAGKVS